MKKEGSRYSSDVTVEFNDTAYNNEALLSRWINDELSPTVSEESSDFLVMDAASFHKTPDILHQLREIKVTCAFIPPGCTSLVQPLDTAIYGPFKQWLREETDEYVAQRERSMEIILLGLSARRGS